MTAKILPQAKVRELFNYDSETGVLTWRIAPRCNPCLLGREAGGLNKKLGYRYVKIQDSLYRVHRVIFLWMTGAAPPEVDHENHIRDDNRWENLKASTHHANARNASKSSNNTSGFNGVYWYRTRGLWLASIGVCRKSICLGYFKHKKDAIAARQAADKKYNFHKNHGV